MPTITEAIKGIDAPTVVLIVVALIAFIAIFKGEQYIDRDKDLPQPETVGELASGCFRNAFYMLAPIVLLIVVGIIFLCMR